MFLKLWTCSGVATSLLLASVGSATTSDKVRINVQLTGSSTVAPLAQTLAKEFEKKNPGIRVDVQTGGSSKGIADCLKGLNDFGMISRDLKAPEKKATAIPVATEGLAFLTSRDLSVESLSADEIKAIYKGEVPNWSSLGGEGVPIFAVSKAEGRGTLDLFKKYFKLKSSEIKAGAVVGDEAQGVKTISSSKGAIGFVSVSTAKSAVLAAGSELRLLKVDGVEPTKESLRTGAYPYARKLQFVKCRPSSEAASQFLEFALSEKGQEVVESAGYLPL